MTMDQVPGPYMPTPEEQAEYKRQHLLEQEKAVWMQYSMIAMQAIKLQGGEFKGNNDIAIKAANLADAMLMEYKDRFPDNLGIPGVREDTSENKQ